MFHRPQYDLEYLKQVFVPGDGPVPCPLMAVGQGPGRVEAASNPPTPFHESAPAGGELTVYLNQIGLPRYRWYLTNAYPYFLCDQFGSDRPPTRAELQSHWPVLEQEIAEVQPRVIACMGAVATRWMMHKAGVSYKDAECHRGLPVGYYGDALLFSCTHPAAGVHSTDSMRHILADFQTLALTIKQLERGEEIKPPIDPFSGKTDYRRVRTVAELHTVLQPRTHLLVAIDTEGSKQDPIMLQFSFTPGTGYAIYAEDAEIVDALGDWLLGAFIPCGGRVILHNALYDLGILRVMGIYLPTNAYTDTMVMAFLLGTEPLGLKPLAYRLAGMDMQSYEEQVSPRSEELAVNYLLDAGQYEWPEAQEQIIREGGKFRVYKPHSVGQRIEKILKDWSERSVKVEHVSHVETEETNKAGEKRLKRHTHKWFEQKFDCCPPGCREVEVERDKPFDVRDRWFKIARALRAPVEEKLGVMHEATLRDIAEAQALQYADRDSDATTRIGPILLKRVKDLSLNHALDIDLGIQPLLCEMMRIGIPADRDHFIHFGAQCQERMDQIQYEIYKETGRDINLASGPQLSNLLFGELRLPSNRWTESRDRLATDKKALEPLRFMHPVVPLVLEWGELETLKNNFAEVLPERMGADGRVHCKIGMTRVPSGRLNTSQPNLMAQPTRSELGKQIRDGFYAPKGYKFVCCDESQIELRVLADLSQDAAMLAVFRNKLDSHTDTAKRLFGAAEPTSTQRAVGKTINFLIANRGGGMALLEQLKLQGLAANDWQKNVKLVDGAIVQNITRKECHRYQALTAGWTGLREPKWQFLAETVTEDRDIFWLEIGPGWTKEMCDFYIAKWYEDHPGVGAWHEALFTEARRFGFVRTWSGRIRYSPEIKSSISRIQEAGKKQIANIGIQAGAQDTMKIGMKLLWDEMQTGRLKRMKVEPMLQVHDDIIALVEDAGVDEYIAVALDIYRNKVAQTMERQYGYTFSIPIDAECKVGDTWGGVKKVKKT